MTEGDMDLVTRLLPLLSDQEDEGFDLFQVMRHGRHEKQLSNIFAWLLDADGSHELGTTFTEIFRDEDNRGLPGHERICDATFSVRQEVNTAPAGRGEDIADIVLDGETSTLVVENYRTSDGHGHSYRDYLMFAASGGRRGVAVLLCETADVGLQTDGWENAPVVTYARLVDRLMPHVDDAYARKHAPQYWFLQQLGQQFTEGLGMDDRRLLSFVEAMCDSGESWRYGSRRPGEQPNVAFADQVRAQALESFDRSREVLLKVRRRLRDYAISTLRDQVNELLGTALFDGEIDARMVGRYQSAVSIKTSDSGGGAGYFGDDGRAVFVFFGPTAVTAHSAAGYWRETVADPDFSRLYVSLGREIRQSRVSMYEVLDGISPEDGRLRDEICTLVQSEGALLRR